jgi:hypothetical protein
MASLVILGTGTIPAQAQRTTTNRPNSALVTAIRNAVGSNISNGFDRIEYFLTEVDLNNDGNKEVVVYTAGLHCGTSECPVYIFRRSGNSYLLIGRTGAISNGGQIAVLPSRSNGWYDIATLVYNPQQRTANWKLHRFNGKSYQNTFQNLSSKPNQIILRPNRGSGISLADPGIASSQVLAQVNQRVTSIRGINLDKVQYIPSETSRDAELNKAIIKWITSTGENFTNEDFRRLSYSYNRVDLNGDGKPEVLVYLVGGSPSCGTGGCHTLIFKTVGTGYDLVSEIGLTRLPIIVTERRTNGWKDLIILTVGGGARANYWLVQFNGRTYPENPGSGSEIPSNSTVTGRAFMSETRGFSGIALQPQDSQIATGRSPNTGQQTTTGRSPSASQFYRDAKSLGMAQFSWDNQELKSAQKKLQLAAQGQYTTLIEAQNIDFLQEEITEIRPADCRAFGFSCENKKITYADYLSLKLKINLQTEFFSKGMTFYDEIRKYNERLSNERRYGGKSVADNITSQFNRIWNDVQTQQQRIDAQARLPLPERLSTVLDQTGGDVIEFSIEVLKTSAKVIATVREIKELTETISSLSSINSERLNRVAGAPKYFLEVEKILKDAGEAFLKLDTEKLRDTTLKAAQATIEFVNSKDRKVAGTGNAIKAYIAAKELIDKDKLLHQPEVTKALDDFDKFYLAAAQLSKAVDVIIAGISIPFSEVKVVDTLAKKADAVNILLFDAIEFSYKNDVRRQYVKLQYYSNRNQTAISGLSSFIDYTAEAVGKYLLRARTDVVTRRPDGTIAVSADGVLYPR